MADHLNSRHIALRQYSVNSILVVTHAAPTNVVVGVRRGVVPVRVP